MERLQPKPVTRRRFGTLFAVALLSLAPTKSEAPEIMSDERLRIVIESKDTLIRELIRERVWFEECDKHIDESSFRQRASALAHPMRTLFKSIHMQIDVTIDALQSLGMAHYDQSSKQTLKIKAARTEQLVTLVRATITEFHKERVTPWTSIKKFWDITQGAMNI